jgi:hypothetical protein
VEGLKARKVRRPRIVAQYAAQVAQWLRENPAISAIEILRRARAAGYTGGKSALYELIRRVRTLEAQSGGSRQLIVVAPGREHLYNFFRRAFAGNPTVQVILDRRVVDRRQHAASRERERRRRLRRSPLRIDGTLRAEGWTIIRLSASRNRRDSA